eukprot:TRINITY_DN37904_c0_g1_i1.p1 TRINITY_DN37904_c0_g1~~TRINITY_DN37904_c0_g1_i1.p1  ORF type:complete len:1122 (-),score=125.23 TRINITY_DN37904_c0_g1_i1:333-3650(-)
MAAARPPCAGRQRAAAEHSGGPRGRRTPPATAGRGRGLARSTSGADVATRGHSDIPDGVECVEVLSEESGGELSAEEAVDCDVSDEVPVTVVGQYSGADDACREESSSDDDGPWRSFDATARSANAALPGRPGFRDIAAAELRRVLAAKRHQRSRGVAGGRASNKAAAVDARTGVCPPLQMHQEAIVTLLHPRSPVSRLLVDQPTGSGKTREMIAVLNRFYFDRRPKVPVFPRAAVCRNFYEELLRWPSRYRDLFSAVRPSLAARAAGLPALEAEDALKAGAFLRSLSEHQWPMQGLLEREIRAICAEMREVLEMKTSICGGGFRRDFLEKFRASHPDVAFPGAPLRALSYASAGGSFASIGDDGKPLSSIMKFGHSGAQCVYSDKIILLDEAHNILHSTTQYSRQLAELRRQLTAASGSVVAAFTATPVSDDPQRGRALLDVIRGSSCIGNRRTCCDEGFIASLVKKGPPLFPSLRPRGAAESALRSGLKSQMCRRVLLQGEALRSYDTKLALGSLTRRQLQCFCNMGSHCSSFHGKHRDAMLRSPREWMPKLAAIAAAIVRHREKTVVLISRQGGYSAMIACLRQAASNATPPFDIATGSQLAEFNASSNKRGESILALVADSAQFSEGTSFRTVRRLYLADIPSNPNMLHQQCGRVSRMFGHHELPLNERIVTVFIPCSVVPEWMRDPLAAWCFRASVSTARDANDDAKAAKLLLKRLHDSGVTSLEKLKLDVDREVKTSVSGQALVKNATTSDSRDESSQSQLEGVNNDVAARLLLRWGLRPPASAFAKWGFRRVGEEKASGPSFKRFNQVVKALQFLHSATSTAVAMASLSTHTADEIAVRALADRLEAQAPALVEVRAVTIDCDDGIVEDDNREAPSDGDDSDWTDAKTFDGIAEGKGIIPSAHYGSASGLSDGASDEDEALPSMRKSDTSRRGSSAWHLSTKPSRSSLCASTQLAEEPLQSSASSRLRQKKQNSFCDSASCAVGSVSVSGDTVHADELADILDDALYGTDLGMAPPPPPSLVRTQPLAPVDKSSSADDVMQPATMRKPHSKDMDTTKAEGKSKSTRKEKKAPPAKRQRCNEKVDASETTVRSNDDGDT